MLTEKDKETVRFAAYIAALELGVTQRDEEIKRLKEEINGWQQTQKQVREEVLEGDPD